ncbi:heavy metal transport/detoxification superfamily protein [Striga asiatica]|uniref:Heavy metal transport/detoxification superfamily protein n=1 Tax=Striga asiatica TaxID=4170 RepID=A0A5A7PJH3_STRAF|nr:heavy metal transport/detoxification superfamily protein [Striga asiatica]
MRLFDLFFPCFCRGHRNQEDQHIKKVVLKVHIQDNKDKQKAMKAVSSLSGVESLAIDMKEKKLTVVGDVDPVEIVSKLRKLWHTDILTVGPAKEPEKKKEDAKKDDNKKEDNNNYKKEDGKKKLENEQMAEMMKMYKNHYNYSYNNPYYTQYYRVYSAEENPNSCVIC